MNADAYRSPPRDLALSPSEIHVWRACIAPRADLDNLARTLADDERRRAARFHFDADRQRFIAARGVLRRVLGRYLQVAPAAIAFSYGPQGKPELQDAAQCLSFNLAHSGDLALYAFAADRRVGIDVELVRDVPEALVIARNHFTPAESRRLQSAGAETRVAFFRLWTRKEAVIKAVGTGVSTPLAEFDVSGEAALDETWQRVQVPSQPLPDWYVHDIPAAEDYRAAIAVEARADEAESMPGPETRQCFWSEED